MYPELMTIFTLDFIYPSPVCFACFLSRLQPLAPILREGLPFHQQPVDLLVRKNARHNETTGMSTSQRPEPGSRSRRLWVLFATFLDIVANSPSFVQILS